MDPGAKTIAVLVNSAEGFARAAFYGEAETVRSVILEGFEFTAGPIFRPL